MGNTNSSSRVSLEEDTRARKSSGLGKRVLFLGPRASGKSTLWSRMWDGKDLSSKVGTNGFNWDTINTLGVKLQLIDHTSDPKLYHLQRHHYNHANMVLYVVDATDRASIEEGARELARLTRSDELVNTPFLVLANKFAQFDRLGLDEIRTLLDLDAYKERRHPVDFAPCDAAALLNINLILEWLRDSAKGTKKGAIKRGDILPVDAHEQLKQFQRVPSWKRRLSKRWDSLLTVVGEITSPA
ncbi:ADP-ribosylation factor protein 3 [Sorochytrium milnesiophthora]